LYGYDYGGANQKVSRLYVDGVLEKESSYFTTNLNSTRVFAIGGNPGFCGNFFVGYIDEVRVYPRALSGAEITQLYTDGNAGLGGPTIIKTGETSVGQVWDLSITPISSSGTVGTLVASSNTVTIAAAGGGGVSGTSTLSAAITSSASLGVTFTGTVTLAGTVTSTGTATALTGNHTATFDNAVGGGAPTSATIKIQPLTGTKIYQTTGTIDANTIVVSTRYNGAFDTEAMPPCIYIVTFDATATNYTVTQPAALSSSNASCTADTNASAAYSGGGNNNVGSKGLQITNGGTGPSANDVYRIAVHQIKIGSMKVGATALAATTGSNVYGVSSDLTNTVLGDSTAFVNGADGTISATVALFSFAGGVTGTGNFTKLIRYYVQPPLNTFVASYVGTVTVTYA